MVTKTKNAAATHANNQADKSKGRSKRPAKTTTTPAPKSKAPTKLQILKGLLDRPDGATLDEMVKATEWQRHSVRGALSGTLKKKRGLNISSEMTDDRGRVYRIVEAD